MKTLSRISETFGFAFLVVGSLFTIFLLGAYFLVQAIIRPLQKAENHFSFDYKANKVLVSGQILCSFAPFVCAFLSDTSF